MKQRIVSQIFHRLQSASITCHVLHGMEGAPSVIGRDVDVMIPRKQWREVCQICLQVAEDLNIIAVPIDSYAGLRVVFFDDPNRCGVFEFHCVRTLGWFALPPPGDVDALSPYKRVFMPLLSRDVEKAKREICKYPLTDRDERAVIGYFEKVCPVGRNIGLRCLGRINAGQYEQAASLLRKTMLLSCLVRPDWILRFGFRRIALWVKKWRHPCGPVAVVFDSAMVAAVASHLAVNSGVLTKVQIIDLSERSFLASFLSLLSVRYNQSYQKVQIVHLPSSWRIRDMLLRRLCVCPCVVDSNEKVSPQEVETQCAQAMRGMLLRKQPFSNSRHSAML